MNEIMDKLEKIDKNTTATLATLREERDTAQTQLGEIESKEEKRKEQLREAQKSFKTIGYKAREEVYDEYEKFAKEDMGASSLSAFMREYSMLLLENRDFQAFFKEFQILQKNDEKHHQVAYFVPQSQFNELEKMAEDNEKVYQLSGLRTSHLKPAVHIKTDILK